MASSLTSATHTAPSHAVPFYAIILAAGQGTRMRSSLPKVLHPIAGRPMVAEVLATLEALAPLDTVLVLGNDMQAVQDVARRVDPGIAIAIQHPPHGTGHAVQVAIEALPKQPNHCLVLYGDTPLIRAETLKQLLSALESPAKPAVAVLGMQQENPADYGRLVVNAGGALERIVEARDATAEERAITLCNSGVMAIRGDALRPLLSKLTNKNAKGEYYLTDLVGHARAAGANCAVVEAPAEELMGVNSKAELAAAEKIMQKRLRAQAMDAGVYLPEPNHVYFCYDTQYAEDVTIYPYVVFGPGVTIGARSVIRSFSHIEGAAIGEDVVVGPFARLRPGAQLAEQVHIGNFVEIKQAKVEKGAKINHLSYVGDARVGAQANIGAGTITCNYDGFDKFHTDIGAGAFIGSNSALVAPVTVGDGAIVGAGSVVTENVEAGSLVLTRAEQLHKPGWGESFRRRKQRKN